MNKKEIHFCSGLPRAGSTVLMNILQQNPRIFTTGTCALQEILTNLVIKSRFKESFQAMSIDQADSAMYGLVNGAAQGWFNGLTDKPVAISKNRGWTGLTHLFPESKYIVTIRDLVDVAESFDRVNRNTKVLHTFDDTLGLLPAMTEDEKYHYFFKSPNPITGVLAHELPRLLELCRQDQSKVLFIRYEDLLADPYKQINKVYDFLGEEQFKHDFNNIQQSDMFEHDHAYFRERTSHKVEPSILTKKVQKRHFSESMQQRIVQENQAFYQTFYPSALKVY